MKKIKVLHCIQSMAWGGLELYTVELIRKLAETGIEQHVFCCEHSRVAEELRKSNISLITFADKKISKIKEAFLIRKVVQQLNITHLQSHTRLDMWACALSRWDSKSPKHIYNLYMNAMPKKDFVHKWLYSKVDAICSSSEFVLAEAKKNFPIDPKKLQLIRYGRQTENYQTNTPRRTLLRQQYGIQTDELVFGTLCRIDPGKGVKELVQALDHLTDEELKKIHMVIVGDPTILGKDKNGQTVYESESIQLSNWIDQQATNSRLKGHLHRVLFQKDFIPFIDLLDVFILASYNETYSLSVLDAMLMEKPVIGTDAGGTTEQVGKNERGHLVTPKDPKSLAQALRFYINNPETITKQGRIARQWVLSQHDWNKTLKTTLELYQGL